MEQNNKESKNKKKIRLLLLFIIIFVVVFCGIYFATGLYNNIVSRPPEQSSSSTQPSASEPVTDKKMKNPVDFSSLKKQNDEIYAWIKIDDTKIDYPIVQSKSNDEFYLKHDAYTKDWLASGAIYTELANNKSFKDPVTVIYGHNGYSDTMFTTLHYFEESDFFENHPYFYIYTPKSKLTYQVISAFKYDDRHILNSFFFADTTELDDFQKMIQNPTSMQKNVRTDLDVEINSSSKIVILSTCITNQKSNRYLVCGVLTNDEKTY